MKNVFVVAALLAFGCAEQQSKRCGEICAREAECSEAVGERSQDFNRAECIKMCTELDKDPQGTKLVEQHAKCVVAAGEDCAAALACD